MTMRHAIQKAGHECLPLLFMLVACGTGVLFYLGNFWPGSPPGWVVVPVLVTLAICTEWLTFTFNQDMQDAFTARRGRGFPVVRALLASTVSTFIFATASSGLWAPRGATDKGLWAWILAVGVFGSQFLLKLVPEKSRAPHSLQNIAAAIEEWMPGATVEEQARIAGRVYSAVSGGEVKALPARLEEVEPLGPFRSEESAEHLGNGSKAHARRK
jgi:hypothetical protein